MTAIVECIKLNDELVSEVRNVTKNIPHWLFSNKTTLQSNWIMKFIMHFSTNRNPLAARWIWGLANLNCRFYTNRINATTHSGIHFVVALLREWCVSWETDKCSDYWHITSRSRTPSTLMLPRQGFVMSNSSNYDGWDRMATDFFLRSMENEELWERKLSSCKLKKMSQN